VEEDLVPLEIHQHLDQDIVDLADNGVTIRHYLQVTLVQAPVSVVLDPVPREILIMPHLQMEQMDLITMDLVVEVVECGEDLQDLFPLPAVMADRVLLQ
jgi:dTDP-D-glucose 4,6-dehydratase